ncbi:hypothetical protein C8R48DRAFT_35211 [Suillus tomentosus]|nr:hypothetical protein C8R48DRAFT_35211 [Suillus tomentosus]
MSCLEYALFRELSIILQAVVVCFIMIIRTYALYGSSKRLFAWLTGIMITLSIAVSAGSFGQFSGDAVLLPGVGCDQTFTTATAARLGLAWVADMVFQLLILILIVYRIFKTRRSLRFPLVARRNVIDIIFHDGAMYFGAMVLVNVPNTMTYYSASVSARGSLSTLTSCLSVTLVSRMMLNLHKSMDAGILSIPSQDEGPSLAVLTTRVDLQSAISPHHD